MSIRSSILAWEIPWTEERWRAAVHGISQARILERIDISFSRTSSQPRDPTQVSHIAGRCFNL